MGIHRKFNFDQYVDELLVEALSLTQMQDQLKQAGLDPAKYDQKHFLFLVGLLNSNQGVEVYDELIHKIKDRGLLSSLMSVSVNDRRSDKPTIDLEKVGKALEHPEDPEQLRAIISGQRREIPAEKEEPAYDSEQLMEFLKASWAKSLFPILVKLRPKLDNTLASFVNEYNNEQEEVKEYLKTNAQRAKTINDLIAILHEGHTKNINPFNTTSSLTLEDLQKGAIVYNPEEHIYIIRTTFKDDVSKSIRWNIKYGQGNRFGLCISSKTSNYYVSYRTGEMGQYPLTTYFVYKLYDNKLDPKDINNYQIMIVDATPDNDVFSINAVATVVGRSKKEIHGKDELKWEFQNRDVLTNTPYGLYARLHGIFGKLIVVNRSGESYNLTNSDDLRKVFSHISNGPLEHKMKQLLNDFDIDEFLTFSETEQIALLTNQDIYYSIDASAFKTLAPEVRMHYVKIGEFEPVESHGLYDLFTDEEKNVFDKIVLKELNTRINNTLKHYGGDSILAYGKVINPHYHNMVLEGVNTPVTRLQYQIAIKDPKLRKIFVDAVADNNKKIREIILSRTNDQGVFRGDINTSHIGDEVNTSSMFDVREVFPVRYVLPDLSDIIIDGNFIVSDCDLTSLKGCPKIIMGMFTCSDNELQDLEGGPIIAHRYNADSCGLKSLFGAPKYVGHFSAQRNHLMELDHLPKVARDISLKYNSLISLKGSPKVVYGDFIVTDNKLRSLEGGPEVVGGQYEFLQNPLKSLKGYTFKRPYHDSHYTFYPYEQLFKEMGFNSDKELAAKTGLSEYDYELIGKHERAIKNSIESQTKVYMLNNKKPEAINKESLLYSLMKSYLLRS